ncbi:MAG: tripartite tricarboxylate transporter substrate binding protein [Deltaproteobacteria bacterium]|nr:tripartite tricarboxylate transporter substrate binding protein [Deltaproteobacteria bacterium]
MKSTFRMAILLVPLLVFGFAAGPAHADYPSKNINWVVQFPPGGGYDAMSRALARSLDKYLPKGIRVIVKNVTGAGGRRGAIYLYRSKPDGHTVGLLDLLGLIPPTITSSKNPGYELNKFQWIARMGNDAYTLFVSGKSPYKTLDDLKKLHRLPWGVEGIGTGRWLPSYLAAKNLGLRFDVVTGYRGTGDSVPGLMRGDFITWLNPSEHSTVGPLAKEGNLRCVVHLAPKRSWACPETPTSAELGNGYLSSVLRLVALPPGVPPATAKKLEEIVVKAMNDPLFTDWAKKSGTPIDPGDSAAAVESASNLIGHVQKEADGIRKALKK